MGCGTNTTRLPHIWVLCALLPACDWVFLLGTWASLHTCTLTKHIDMRQGGRPFQHAHSMHILGRRTQLTTQEQSCYLWIINTVLYGSVLCLLWDCGAFVCALLFGCYAGTRVVPSCWGYVPAADPLVMKRKGIARAVRLLPTTQPAFSCCAELPPRPWGLAASYHNLTSPINLGGIIEGVSVLVSK